MKKLIHLTLCLLLSAGTVAPVSARLTNAKEMIKRENLYTIYVKLGTSTTTLTYRFYPTDLIGDVKNAVSHSTGWDPGVFDLYFNLRELDERNNLAFYGIGDGYIINASK